MKFGHEKIFYTSLILKFILLSVLYNSIIPLKVGFNPYVKKLSSGRYCLISSEGITFLSQDLTHESNTINFTKNIYPDDYSYSINIEQFSQEDGEYIIIFFYNYLYFFYPNETLIKAYESINFIDYPLNIHNIVVPYGHYKNNHYFSIIYLNDSNIIFNKGTFNSISKSISFSTTDVYSDAKINLLNYFSFSCKQMKYKYDNVINCIYGNSNILAYNSFDPYNNFTIIEELSNYVYDSSSPFKYFKLLILPNKELSIPCYTNETDYHLYCGKYNISSNSIIKYFDFPFDNLPDFESMLFIEYFNETNKILFGVNDYSLKMNIYQCTLDLVCENIKENYLSTQISSVFPNIVIPKNKNNYYVLFQNYDNGTYISLPSNSLKILNNLTYNGSITSNELNCTHYYNYNHTECITKIPEGYYCNDTQLKTIDKCHDKCKTCEKGPSENNHNCETCDIESFYKYYDVGNCVTYCNNSTYNFSSTLMCECSKNITCKICTQKSLELNLCLMCNNDLGYYEKGYEEVRSDKFVNCYKDLGGHYLYNNKYYQCYESCKNCTEEGYYHNHKCTECYDGDELKYDFENVTNCYEKCDFYYYDEFRNYYCITDGKCPKNYSKLISEKGRCIDACKKDNIYKFEYKNKCHRECPPGTKDLYGNNTCIGELSCEKYYNYDHSDCLDTIPAGYYLNDSIGKTIDKCHDNCEFCIKGPTNNNTNCLKCKNSLYLDLGNCVKNCTNGFIVDEDIKVCRCSKDNKCEICSEETIQLNKCLTCNNEEGYYPKYNDTNNILFFVDCYNNETISEGYYLNGELKIYEPCYNTCKKCSSYGDKNNNKCDECKPGYDFNPYITENPNCYQICNYYYYFDSSNNYHCTETNKCPDNYKLINSKKKCIDSCKKDGIYKYEYQNQCYSSCPNNTEANEDNICVLSNYPEILDCPEEYPYELIYEKKCVKE